MSLPNPYAQYRQNSIETATSTRIVVMLYDGAIRFLTQALTAMAAKQPAEQSRLIGNAQAIIAHLHDTLDKEIGSAFAASLLGIYTALLRTLTQANIENQPQPVDEAIAVLRELRETWAEVDRQCRVGKSTQRELIAA
jgi:flagellar protein FliS